jgi:hypothetical protein
MQVTPSDIRTVISKEDDFGHEMRVGSAIRSIPAIEVEHGGTYTDPVTQKPRQFDYRCSLRKEAARLSLALECKNLSSAVPLIVCGTKRQRNEAFHDLIEARFGRFQRRSAIINGQSSVTRRARDDETIYPSGEFLGKSLVRIQTDKTPMIRTPDADVYDKWAQALSSAVGLAEMACEAAKLADVTKVFSAVLPLVVVPDGLLWKVTYDVNGSVGVDPMQVDECELFVGREIELGKKGTPLFHQFTFSHVHFFTLTGARSFLSKMAMNDHAWAKLFNQKSAEL